MELDEVIKWYYWMRWLYGIGWDDYMELDEM